jgi:hypothetical protein
MQLPHRAAPGKILVSKVEENVMLRKRHMSRFDGEAGWRA